MDDLVDRLRDPWDFVADDRPLQEKAALLSRTMNEAATEIEWLQAETKRLRSALEAAEKDARRLREALFAIVDADLTYFDGYVDRHLISYGKVRAARAALEEKR